MFSSATCDKPQCRALHSEMELCVVVEDVVRGQLVQVGEQVQPVVRLDVVQPVREDLQQSVKSSPRLLGEHLHGEKLKLSKHF